MVEEAHFTIENEPCAVGRTTRTLDRLVFVAGSFFFAGCAPRLRGTIGTLVPAVLVGLIETLLGPPWWWTLPAAALVAAAGIPLGSAAERIARRKDPPWFVLDEVMGILLAVTGQAALCGRPWLAAGAAFVAFRLFDGLKPPPIRRVERLLGGGAGIMADDFVAALAAWPAAWAALSVLAR